MLTLKSCKIENCDCREGIKTLASNSIDFIVTDPPYFIDGMDSEWDDAKLRKKAAHSGVIGGLPVGMKFSTEQGIQLQEFIFPLAKEFLRVLKPGAFCVVFSQARLYHRMAMALDEAGFEIRDMLAWKYEGQPKAFSLDHFVRKQKDLSDDQKGSIINAMKGWKTPQLKPQIEPMVLAQKKRDGTFLENWQKWGVGLLNTTETLDGQFPGNVMCVPKKVRLIENNGKSIHMTPKPVCLIAHLIRLFTKEGQTVLDPFLGSGSHAIAAIQEHRKFVGFEIEKKYVDIARQRLLAILPQD